MIEGYSGPPRAGKTIIATGRALEEMEAGKRIVVSNYPIKHPKLGYTYMWTGRDMIYKIHNDAFVVIDEAYRDYDFRNPNNEKFSEDEDLWYGTTGQNNIDVIWITHSPIRVDPKIRDRTEMYHQISKQTLPIISLIWRRITGREIILWFNDRAYLDEQSASAKALEPYAEAMHLFHKKWAKAYDTTYFRDHEPNEGLEIWTPLHPEPPKPKIIERIKGFFAKIARRSK